MRQVLLDAAAMKRTLGRLAHEILEDNGGPQDLVVVGILRKGWPLAKRLAFLMAQVEDTPIPHGRLDITPFRDDRPAHAEDLSEIPFSINNRKVILVDEVIFTGRTIRAALDALRQYGRPASVQLAVLIDRGHRELPIKPDFCGRTLATQREDRIEVNLTDYAEEDGVLLIPAMVQPVRS